MSEYGPPDDYQMREARFHLKAARTAIDAAHRKGFDVGGARNEWMRRILKVRDAVDEASTQLRVTEILGRPETP